MMCPGVGHLCGFILVCDSLQFLDLYVYFLHQVREVFSHYFFKYSFWHSYDVNVVVLDDVPEVPETIFIFKNLLYFCCCDWGFSATLFSKLLILSSDSSNLMLIPYSICFISEWFFFMVSTSLYKFSLNSPILSLSLFSMLMACVLNSASSKLLSSICLVLFMEFLSFVTCLFVSSFWLPPCVCFCAFGRSAMFQSWQSGLMS